MVSNRYQERSRPTGGVAVPEEVVPASRSRALAARTSAAVAGFPRSRKEVAAALRSEEAAAEEAAALRSEEAAAEEAAALRSEEAAAEEAAAPRSEEAAAEVAVFSSLHPPASVRTLDYLDRAESRNEFSHRGARPPGFPPRQSSGSPPRSRPYSAPKATGCREAILIRTCSWKFSVIDEYRY